MDRRKALGSGDSTSGKVTGEQQAQARPLEKEVKSAGKVRWRVLQVPGRCSLGKPLENPLQGNSQL